MHRSSDFCLEVGFRGTFEGFKSFVIILLFEMSVFQ